MTFLGFPQSSSFRPGGYPYLRQLDGNYPLLNDKVPFALAGWLQSALQSAAALPSRKNSKFMLGYRGQKFRVAKFLVEARGIEPLSKTGFPSLPRASSLYYFSM